MTEQDKTIDPSVEKQTYMREKRNRALEKKLRITKKKAR